MDRGTSRVRSRAEIHDLRLLFGAHDARCLTLLLRRLGLERVKVGQCQEATAKDAATTH